MHIGGMRGVPLLLLMGGAKGYLATAGLRGAGCHWSRAETTIARSGNALTLQVVPEATHNVSAATFADLMGKVVATSASVMGQAALSVIEQVGEDGKEAVRTRKARAEHMATLVQLQGPEQERQELASPPLSAGLFGLGLASVVAVEPLAMLTAGAAALAARSATERRIVREAQKAKRIAKLMVDGQVVVDFRSSIAQQAAARAAAKAAEEAGTKAAAEEEEAAKAAVKAAEEAAARAAEEAVRAKRLLNTFPHFSSRDL